MEEKVSQSNEKDKNEEIKFSETQQTKQNVGLTDHNIYINDGDNIAEDLLKNINYIILYGGIAISLILAFLLSSSDDKFYTNTFFAVLLGGAFISTFLWSTSMILINLSINIRTIKHILAHGYENNSYSPEQYKYVKVSQPTSNNENIENSNETITILFKKGDKIKRLSDGKNGTVTNVHQGRVYCSFGLFGIDYGNFSPSELINLSR